MAEPLKIMIVCGDDKTYSALDSAIRNTLKETRGVQSFHSREGYQAYSKMLMLPPDILLTEWDLSTKYSGQKLVEEVFKDPKLQNISVVVLTEAPEGDIFVDQVVSGKLQFSPPPFDQVHFTRTIAKAAQRKDGNSEFKLKILAKDEMLFREGDPAESTFLVRAGKLLAFREIDGKEQTLGEIAQGEFVGEMAYISGEPRSANVRALQNSELIEVPISSLDSLIFSKPAWSKALMKTLSNRLKLSNTKKI